MSVNDRYVSDNNEGKTKLGGLGPGAGKNGPGKNGPGKNGPGKNGPEKTVR